MLTNKLTEIETRLFEIIELCIKAKEAGELKNSKELQLLPYKVKEVIRQQFRSKENIKKTDELIKAYQAAKLPGKANILEHDYRDFHKKPVYVKCC